LRSSVGLAFLKNHHAFFFKKAKPTEDLNVAHAAFEVHDFDIQQLGHKPIVEYLTAEDMLGKMSNLFKYQ
jgi:hypothetical protein